jgi:hypothetical protein
VAIVVGWFVSLPLWGDAKAWQVAIHTIASVLTLLLVALLENAGRRSAEAAQEKLNVIAEALAALMASRAVEDHTLEEAVTRLRDAVGLDAPLARTTSAQQYFLLRAPLEEQVSSANLRDGVRDVVAVPDHQVLGVKVSSCSPGRSLESRIDLWT